MNTFTKIEIAIALVGLGLIVIGAIRKRWSPKQIVARVLIVSAVMFCVIFTQLSDAHKGIASVVGIFAFAAYANLRGHADWS